MLAIDFGTSNSLVGVLTRDKIIEALPLDTEANDPTVMRSLVYFPNEDHAHYGVEAIKMYIQNEFEGRLFRSFKSHLSNVSYLGSVIGKNRRLPIEELVGLFLLQLKRKAESSLGQNFNSVVLGRPARYSMDPLEDEMALFRMKKAAEFAGFSKTYFVPEPLAAAFNFRKTSQNHQTFLIGDFGGGTSDFTILKLHPGEFKKQDVLAIEGCPLAGDYIDSLFMSQNLNRYFGARAKYKLPLSQNLLTMPPLILDRLNKPAHTVHLKEPATYEFIKEIRKVATNPEDKTSIQRLLNLVDDNQIFSFFEEIEKTKRIHSYEDQANFEFNYPEIEVKEKFTRLTLENWAMDFKSQIFATLDRSLSSAQLTYNQIDLICLTGGTAFVPFIREEFNQRFGHEKLQTSSHFHSVQTGLIEAASLVSQGIDIGVT